MNYFFFSLYLPDCFHGSLWNRHETQSTYWFCCFPMQITVVGHQAYKIVFYLCSDLTVSYSLKGIASVIWSFTLIPDDYRAYFQWYLLFPPAAMGIVVPAADFHQWAQLCWSCGRFPSQQAGSYKGLQRQSQSTCAKEEAVDTVQLREHCEEPRQHSKTQWGKAVIPSKENILINFTVHTTSIARRNSQQFHHWLEFGMRHV